jgi:hypothetical protein
VACLLGAAGLGFRGWLTWRGIPATNSDEAAAGLAALHISQGRAFPIFFYGQYYLGAVYSYLAAPFIFLAGTSPFVLRLPALLLYGAFLITMYFLVKRLYTPRFAVVILGLLSLGGDRVIRNELIGGGLYPESLFCTALLFYLSTRKPVQFVVWGLLAGVMLWDSWNTLPYLFVAGVLVFRDAGRRGLLAVPGLLIGAAPLFVHNIFLALPAQRSPHVLQVLMSAGSDAPLTDRLTGGILFGLPLSLGLCEPSLCRPWQVAWAPLLLALFVLALVQWCLRSPLLCTRIGNRRNRLPMWVQSKGGEHNDIRAGLVVAGVGTIVLYATSPAAADSPLESARYLHLLLVTLPALLWPLWRLRIPGRVVLAGLAATMCWATMHVSWGEMTKTQGQQQVLAVLRQRGVTAYYGDYWACMWGSFGTREKIVCAVLNDDFSAGFDRYPPYREQVALAKPQVYVASAGSAFDQAVARKFAGTPHALIEVTGYRIYDGRYGNGRERLDSP